SQPVELVVEFRAGLRIAVWRIDAGDDDAGDRGFDVARLAIAVVARQFDPGQHRLRFAREDRKTSNGSRNPQSRSKMTRGGHRRVYLRPSRPQMPSGTMLRPDRGTALDDRFEHFPRPDDDPAASPRSWSHHALLSHAAF